MTMKRLGIFYSGELKTGGGPQGIYTILGKL